MITLEKTERRVLAAKSFTNEFWGVALGVDNFKLLCERLEVPKVLGWEKIEIGERLPEWFSNSHWLREIVGL